MSKKVEEFLAKFADGEPAESVADPEPADVPGTPEPEAEPSREPDPADELARLEGGDGPPAPDPEIEEEPKSEIPPEDEPEAEADEASPEPEPEGSDEEDAVYGIPEDGEFEIEVEKGKFKTYSGKAVNNLIRQGRLSSQKADEIKAEREKLDRERQDWETNRKDEIDRVATRRMIEAGAIQQDPETGAWVWHPAIDPAKRAQVQAAAQRDAASDVDRSGSPEPTTVQRLTAKDLGDDADLVPDALLERHNQLVDIVNQQNQTISGLRTKVTAREEADHRSEAQKIHDALVSEVTALGLEEDEAQDVYDLAVVRMQRQDSRPIPEIVQGIGKRFGAKAQETTTLNDPKPTAAPRRRVLDPPKRRRAAPPAVGSGRRPAPADPDKVKPAPEFGNQDSKDHVAEVLRRFSGG